MSTLKVGVWEAPPEMEPGSAEWKHLGERLREEAPDLFLLNEMPFGSWVAAGDSFDPATWRRTLEIHEEGVSRLDELGARVVLGSRPRELDGLRVNEAFVWTAAKGYRAVHTKQYFPDEPGYYEARWFQAGKPRFTMAEAGLPRVGFLICTDVMFNEYARRYGRRGAHIIAVPRAVGRESLARWLVAMKMAAIVSGCYVMSSNRGGVDGRGQEFGGRGWVIDPQGDLAAQTSAASRVALCHVDLDSVAVAQSEYPCYVAAGQPAGGASAGP